MKKFIGLLLTGMFVTAGLTSQAQKSTSDEAYLLNLHNIGTDKAAVRATHDFWTRTGDQTNASWFKLPQGFMAEYYTGSIQAHFLYDQKGDYKYSMLTYSEKEMPAGIRQLVRSTYYDYSIRWVKEIHEAETTAYVVHIEDAVSWKDVVVQDGEMRVLHAYCKQ